MLQPAQPWIFLRQRTWIRLSVALVALWCVAQWFVFRPHTLAVDWNNWRQADTQSMALRFLEPGSSIWYPKVNWGGDGPGFVECEFPAYAYLVSLAFRLFGPSEAVSQGVSLLSAGLAAWLLFDLLRREFGGAAALAGSVAFLCSRAFVFIATAIQPEALSVLFAIASLGAAFEWKRRPQRWWWLVLHGLLGALACLTKPTAAQVLLASGLVFLATPVTRARWKLIVGVYAWVALVGLAYVAHAKSIYLEHGNTFGLLSGGDRKTPLLEHLIHPWLYWMALKLFLKWGAGWGLLVVAAVALARRRWPWTAWALLISAGAWSLASLRYSHMDFGSHYMVLGGLSTAWLVAAQFARPTRGWRSRAAMALCGSAMLATGAINHVDRYQIAQRAESDEPLIELGRELKALVQAGELVVVQSSVESWDEWWKSVNNYEDPTLLYLSSTRGWVVPSDEANAERIADFARRGARWFVSAQGPTMSPAVRSWLLGHGAFLRVVGVHEIWRLHAPDHPEVGDRMAGEAVGGE